MSSSISEYRATIVWQRAGETFTDNKYSRLHEWRFDDGTVVAATASPHIVPPPHSDGRRVDPEEAFVAALSSCHMLFFLSFAARQGLLIDRYTDQAMGILADRGDGKLAMTEVTLQPAVTLANSAAGSDEMINSLHHAAHEHCFIASSVNTRISIQPR
jgi:organic hydroperoxide reductase OsmC/OhrA